MDPEVLIFMQNGDVTLQITRYILEEEEPEIAIEDGQPEIAPAFEPAPPAELDDVDDGDLFYAPDAPDSETFYPPPRTRARGSDASSRRDRSTSPPASFWASLQRQKAKLGEPNVDTQSATLTKPAKKEIVVLSSHEVQCVVSSRHMMLASRYFESLLSGNSNEAATLRSKKHISIPLLVDLDAMIILLNIVHGLSRKVPRQVKLETLRKLATLVSAFGMIDAVQFFSDTWIDEFQRKGLPTAYDEKVLSLLFVFWVFDRPAEFKNMTKIAQRECSEQLDEDAQEIPIPRSIIDAIKRDREFAMESAIAVIHTLINKYLDGHTICDGAREEELAYACDATVLGSLMKSSRKIGIWPKPEAPFPGRKFKELAQAVRSIKVLDVCKKSSSRRLHLLGPSSNSHGLEDSIEAAMKDIEAGVDGLDLAEYAKKGDDYNFEVQAFIASTSEVKLEERENENTEGYYSGYLQDEAEALRRDYSVSPPMISTHPSTWSLEESLQSEVKPSPKQHSVTTASPTPVNGHIHEESGPIWENGITASRNSWNHKAEVPFYDNEQTIERNVQNREALQPVLENGGAISRDIRDYDKEKIPFEQENAAPRDFQEPRVKVHIEQRVERNPDLRTREVEDPVDLRPRIFSRNARSEEANGPVYGPQNVWPEDSWEQPAKETVVEQRKASPQDYKSQQTTTPPTTVSVSPVEQSNVELKASVDVRMTSNTSCSRNDVKPAVQESNMTLRNPSTERVKAMGDKTLQRSPSSTMSLKEEVRLQQQPVATQVKIPPNKKAYALTSNLKDEVKPQIAPQLVSTEEARVFLDKKTNTKNPFTSSDANSPTSKPLVAPRKSSTEDAIDRDRRPITTNPFTRTSNNEVKSPLQTPSTTPRVASREEVAALTNKKLIATSFFPDTIKDNNKYSSQSLAPSRTSSTEEVKKQEIPSQVSRTDKRDLVAPTFEVRQASSDALLTTEDEETLIAPQKLNMRKSKKKCQVKY